MIAGFSWSGRRLTNRRSQQDNRPRGGAHGTQAHCHPYLYLAVIHGEHLDLSVQAYIASFLEQNFIGSSRTRPTVCARRHHC